MDQSMREEYIEVRQVAEKVLADIDGALNQLKRAKNWSMWDLFGGEFMTSWMKRRRMQDAEDYLSRLCNHLKELSDELQDVDHEQIASIDFSPSRAFWDLIFDNVFTDYKVHQEIKDAIYDLEKLRIEIEQLIDITESIIH